MAGLLVFLGFVLLVGALVAWSFHLEKKRTEAMRAAAREMGPGVQPGDRPQRRARGGGARVV